MSKLYEKVGSRTRLFKIEDYKKVPPSVLGPLVDDQKTEVLKLEGYDSNEVKFGSKNQYIRYAVNFLNIDDHKISEAEEIFDIIFSKFGDNENIKYPKLESTRLFKNILSEIEKGNLTKTIAQNNGIDNLPDKTQDWINKVRNLTTPIKSKKLDELVDRYINIVEIIGIDKYAEKHEKYKFEFVSNFKKNFNIKAENFVDMLDRSLIDNNLTRGLHYWPRNHILELGREFEDETRNALDILFDESLDINDRINLFDEEINKINKLCNDKLSKTEKNFLDFKFITLLLSSKIPEKYYYIKPGEWNSFLNFIGIKPHSANKSSKGERYLQYSEYADLLNQHIRNINEIDNIRLRLTRDTEFKDNNFVWMTQDLIYTAFKKHDLLSDTQNLEKQLGVEIIDLLANKQQLILYGPPGTGKTFMTKKLAVKLVGDTWGDIK